MEAVGSGAPGATEAAMVMACPTPFAAGSHDRRNLRGLYASMVSPTYGGRCQSPTRGAQELGKLIREPEQLQSETTRSPKQTLSRFVKDSQNSPDKAAEHALAVSASDAPEVVSARRRAARARTQRNAAVAQAARRRLEAELAAAASPALPIASGSQEAEVQGCAAGTPSSPLAPTPEPKTRRRIFQKGKSPIYEAAFTEGEEGEEGAARRGKRPASADRGGSPDPERPVPRSVRRKAVGGASRPAPCSRNRR